MIPETGNPKECKRCLLSVVEVWHCLACGRATPYGADANPIQASDRDYRLALCDWCMPMLELKITITGSLFGSWDQIGGQ